MMSAKEKKPADAPTNPKSHSHKYGKIVIVEMIPPLEEGALADYGEVEIPSGVPLFHIIDDNKSDGFASIADADAKVREHIAVLVKDGVDPATLPTYATMRVQRIYKPTVETKVVVTFED
jgi:hypothetical protein